MERKDYALFFKSPLWIKRTLVVGLAFLTPTAFSYAQKINLVRDNITLRDALVEFSKQSKHDLVLDRTALTGIAEVSVDLKDVALTDALPQLLKDHPLGYSITDKAIVIKKKTIKEAVFMQQTISGLVVDRQGVPLSGVSIKIKGTNLGVSTNQKGEFSIEYGGKPTLVISYVGYLAKEISLNDTRYVQITLDEDVSNLDEVVVIGYGTQKKADVTGSVTTVSGDKLANLPTAGAEEALQGMASGLSINMGSGAPGAKPTMMVRGVTTWGSSNDPLVIIDGIPGDMSFVNPEDIKSVSVLKDAALASIYGARSAAGVILVETHRGVNKPPKLSFSVYYGINDLPKRMEVANSAEYIKINKMALQNAGIVESRWPKYIAAYEANPTDFADTDWQKEYYRSGSNSKYNLGYSAGGENMNLAFSGFYSKTKGIVTGTEADKYGFRINSDIRRGKFKIGESINYGRKTEKPEADTGFPGMYQTTNIQPLIHVYNSDNEGGFGGAIPGLGMTDAANPVAFNQLIDTKDANDYLSASGYISYSPIKDLTVKFQAGRNIDFRHYKSFRPTYYVGANSVNTIASLSEIRSKNMEDILELTANYVTVVRDRHHIEGLLGLSQEESVFDDQTGSVSRFENNDMRYLIHGQENAAVKGGYLRGALRSAFGRLNYNYDYKYMAMLSARYDGSSRFGEGNEWGFFPSASLGWNIANESFWEGIKDKVSTLKLRASFGNLGNQSIGNYMYISRLTYNTDNTNYPLSGDGINLGYAVTGLPSTNIKWETTRYKNIGLDMAFLKNRLDVSIEAYVKDTYDMLSSKNVSLATGFGPLIVNEGKLQTKGLELQASYKGSSNDFKYNFDINLSHYKSVLRKMSDPGYRYESGPARTYVGGEIGEFWVWQTAGIFQNQDEVNRWNQDHGSKDASGQWIPLQPAAKPGDIRFIDQNGDGKLDSYDRVFIGSGNPDLVLGFNVNLSYRSFDLTANFYGNFGAKRYNYMKRQLQRMDKNFNYGKDALAAWTPENTNTDIPRAVIGDPNGNISTSDRFVENGDYLRLNNLQIGYNLPVVLRDKLKLSDCRIYAGATRLFTLTKYKGYDPGTGAENGLMGVDDAIYPLSRTFMLGLRIGF
ncbi:TonB-dependent receptor [Sphingobacterium paucimobilis]|nr:TonB-dependent receptor [Sphingobacterium paucimobilis]